MVKLAIDVLPHFIDHAVQCAADPSYGAELFRIIGTSVDDVLRIEERLHLLKANASLGIRLEPPAFLPIEVEARMYNSYTTKRFFTTYDLPS